MLPDPILKQLAAAQTDRRLVAYHCYDDDPTIFIVGFVEEIKSDRIIIHMVGPHGEPEYKTDVVAMADIQWLDFDTEYLKGLEKLYPVYNELIGKKPTAGIRAANREAITRNLKDALRKNEIVLIEVDKETRDVLVREVAEPFFAYIEIRDGGQPDGISWLKIDHVKVLKRKTDRQIADRFLLDLRGEVVPGE